MRIFNNFSRLVPVWLVVHFELALGIGALLILITVFSYIIKIGGVK